MLQISRSIAGAGAVGVALALLASSGIGSAQAHDIRTTDAWARSAPAMAGMDKGATEKKGGHGAGGGNGAVYVTLTNTGSRPDALVSASTDAAGTVELHEVQQEGGVMKMRPVKSIPVAAGGKTELKPGGYHIMLLGLKRDLKPGDKVPVTLRFERAGEMKIEAAVR